MKESLFEFDERKKDGADGKDNDYELEADGEDSFDEDSLFDFKDYEEELIEQQLLDDHSLDESQPEYQQETTQHEQQPDDPPENLPEHNQQTQTNQCRKREACPTAEGETAINELETTN